MLDTISKPKSFSEIFPTSNSSLSKEAQLHIQNLELMVKQLRLSRDSWRGRYEESQATIDQQNKLIKELQQR